jgi:hypothetical protein
LEIGLDFPGRVVQDADLVKVSNQMPNEGRTG